MSNTSLLTAVGALGGLLQYAGNTGLTLPQTKQDWASFGVSLTLAALGLLAKGAEKK